MASEVEIANRALQKLGAARITSLTDNSVNARACNACYTVLRDSELRAHPWNFSISRAILAADATVPVFTRANAFQLPSDFLRLLPRDPEDNIDFHDWQIEGQKIYTNDAAPLHIRYVAQVTDPNKMDVLFRETLAARMGVEMAEELTQSNPKKAALLNEYSLAIREARRTNAIENPGQDGPTDTWLSVRS